MQGHMALTASFADLARNCSWSSNGQARHGRWHEILEKTARILTPTVSWLMLEYAPCDQ